MSDRPEVVRGVPVPTPVLVEPSEKRSGLVYPACVVGGRFTGDVGRGILNGDEKVATLEELPVLVDVRAVESPPPIVDGFRLMNILSDACFNLLGSGRGFDTEVDLRAAGAGFGFEIMVPIDFGGRSLGATVVDGGAITVSS